MMNKANAELPRVLVISIDGLGYNNWNRSGVPMPNLKKLAERGVEAGINSITPSATWAIHTSLVCGTYPRKHGVLGNWVVDRGTNQVGEHFGERMYPKEESVHGLTIYDAVKQIGGTTAALCWPKTWGATGLDFVIPECYEQELMEAGSTASLWRELVELGLPMHRYASWSKDHARGPMQDWLTTEIAKHLIWRHSPHLLLVHYLLPDSYQHDYGTHSEELDWSLTYIDERIGELLQELEASGGLEETYVVVMSDHGFADAARTFYPNVLFKQLGWFDEACPERSRVMAVSNGGSGYAYLLEPDPEEKEKLREQVRSRLRSVEGVRLLVEDDADFEKWGLPAGGEHSRFKPDFAFDMHLDWFVNFGHQGGEVTAERSKFTGMHGYFADRDEMKAFFVAAGPGIERGVRLPDIGLVDVAPTVASWFGIVIPDADGKKLMLGRRDGRSC
ncbi:alkaline phosphatase family protein [Paenibacillus sp. IB182363]|uniref:Alkaline phosphatase family protein n=2 Tax=Paenibacillus oceani TaxID=2772510 RepID=A0A927CD10_9BACL|nr:alkaline phosphatase family protein [Paenibacillus oceani]